VFIKNNNITLNGRGASRCGAAIDGQCSKHLDGVAHDFLVSATHLRPEPLTDLPYRKGLSEGASPEATLGAGK